MKHVTYASKTVFMDGDTADALIEYAAALAAAGSSDSVKVGVISGDGKQVEAHFLLNASTAMVSESTNASTEPPRDENLLREILARTRALTHPPEAQPEGPSASDGESFEY